MTQVTELPAFAALLDHAQQMHSVHMRDLFQQDTKRAEHFSLKACDIFLDYSKNRITETTLEYLLQFAEQTLLPHFIEHMFRGDKINTTENRAVLHTALRAPKNYPLEVMPKIHAVLNKMQSFVEKVHSGEWRGFEGDKMIDIVNIGIGGSDLGPAMVMQALKPFHQPYVNVHFISNIDGNHLIDTLKPLHPRTTLFIIASKTFTTQETLANARAAKAWLLQHGAKETDIAKHFVAVSTNSQKVTEFGIDTMFEFWEFVGGRYSLWSSIGLSIALGLGMHHFKALLNGAHHMDEHFKNSPLRHNMPVILGLLSFWYIQFFGAQTQAILPYDHHLQKLVPYLQQVDMESNGKSITREGKPVNYPTGPVIFGDVGTNSQHAFMQLLHQGPTLIPSDFIIALQSHHSLLQHHSLLVANCFAQTEALMMGKKESPSPEQTFLGNRPSNTLVLPQLTPQSLGALLALYEHKVFVQSVLFNINAFDQFGVELGKQLAQTILDDFDLKLPISVHDSSTTQLIRLYKEQFMA